jgi:hypothetical protein
MRTALVAADCTAELSARRPGQKTHIDSIESPVCADVSSSAWSESGPPSRAAWVYGHDYAFPFGLAAPGRDPRRRGIDSGRRSIGRTVETVTADRSVVHLAGQLYERQNPDADLDHAVTAVAAADGANRWRTEFDGDRFDSSVEGVVDAGGGAVVGFDQAESVGGGGFGGDTPGRTPEVARFDADGELAYTMAASALEPEPDASFAAAAATVFVSNGRLDEDPVVAGYDVATGERRFLDRPATVAATTETTAFLVRPGESDTLVARRGSDGAVRWEQSVGRVHDLAVGPDRVYVVGVSGGGTRLHAFDRAVGANRWSVQPDVDPNVGPVVLDDAVLVAGRTVSVYGRDGAELGPVSEDARSPTAYDRVRTNDDHVLLTTRPDRTQRRTVAIDRQTWAVSWTTETFVPIIGAADESFYVVSGTRQTQGREENGNDTRIRRVAGADRDTIDEFWVHGGPRSVDGDRLYTLLQTTDTALDGLYAYDLPG